MLTREQMQYKIDYEIIVDCYDEYEQSMGWYYYFEEVLKFPFTAKTKLKNKTGKVEIVDVEVVGLAADEEGFMYNDFDLEVVIGEHICNIAYSELFNISADEDTMDAFAIWNYWIKK